MKIHFTLKNLFYVYNSVNDVTPYHLGQMACCVPPHSNNSFFYKYVDLISLI